MSSFQSIIESFRGKWEDGFWYKGNIEKFVEQVNADKGFLAGYRI